MKKIALILFALTIGISAIAQNRNVSLPNKPYGRTAYKDFSEDAGRVWLAGELKTGTSVLINRKNVLITGATITGGYRFNEYLKVGLGIGGKFHFNNSNLRTAKNEWAFPVYADCRGNIVSQQDRNAVPYWSVDLGGEINGGIYFSPTIGYRFGMPHDSFLLGLSYELVNADTWKKENETISALVLKIGYEF